MVDVWLDALSLQETLAPRDAKPKIGNRIDLGEEKKRVKVRATIEKRERLPTFEMVAREEFERKSATLMPGYPQRIASRLENRLFPCDGAFFPSATYSYGMCVRPMEERGAVGMAHRLVQLGQVYPIYSKK